MKDKFNAPFTNAFVRNVDSKGLEWYLWRCKMILWLCVEKKNQLMDEIKEYLWAACRWMHNTCQQNA